MEQSDISFEIRDQRTTYDISGYSVFKVKNCFHCTHSESTYIACFSSEEQAEEYVDLLKTKWGIK